MSRLILALILCALSSVNATCLNGPGSSIFRWDPQILTTCPVNDLHLDTNCCGGNYDFCLEKDPLYNLEGDLMGKEVGCSSMYCQQSPRYVVHDCYVSICTNEICTDSPRPNGITCDDGNNASGPTFCFDGSCGVPASPIDLPSTCILHNDQAWCTHPTMCGVPCIGTCEALSMEPLSNASAWLEAQNTNTTCSALSGALGLTGHTLDRALYGCLEAFVIETDSPQLDPSRKLVCTVNDRCPTELLTNMDQFGQPCNRSGGGRLAVCPCGDGLLHPQCAYQQDFTQCDDGDNTTENEFCLNGACTRNSAVELCNCVDESIQHKCGAWRSEFPIELTGVVCIDEADKLECSKAEVMSGSQCPVGSNIIGICSAVGTCLPEITGYECLQTFETEYGNFALNMSFQIKQNIGVWTVVDSKTLTHENSGIFYNLANADVLFGSGTVEQHKLGLDGDFFYGVKFITQDHGRKSCNNRCGFRGEHQCWCDDKCRYHNDCCDDICESCGLFCADSGNYGYFEMRSADYVHRRTD